METFKRISWNVPVVVETDFISTDGFQSTSLAYKILHGSFKAEISSDSSDELSEFEMKYPAKKKTRKKVKKANGMSNKGDLKETSKYIPLKTLVNECVDCLQKDQEIMHFNSNN